MKITRSIERLSCPRSKASEQCLSCRYAPIVNTYVRLADGQSPTPRNDFCRMFVREGILDPLSSSLLSILRDGDLGIAHESVTRSINVLLLFSQISQADSRVREAFASRTVIIRGSLMPYICWTDYQVS